MQRLARRPRLRLRLEINAEASSGGQDLSQQKKPLLSLHTQYHFPDLYENTLPVFTFPSCLPLISLYACSILTVIVLCTVLELY
jgi:hypothetical protein